MGPLQLLEVTKKRDTWDDWPAYSIWLIYRVDQKKTGISNKMAITTWKSIRKGKSWCVLENSA